MVYDWDGKEARCFELYIEQGKSLEEVMRWFRENEAFAPSKRAFQTQIKKWNFPPKHNPASNNVDLVNRVEDLWKHNTHQKDMLAILHDEGFNRLSDRELARIRSKNNWKLRVPNKRPSKPDSSDPNPPNINPSKRSHEEADLAATAYKQLVAAAQRDSPPKVESVHPPTSPKSTVDLSPEALEKRRLYHQRIAAESDERYIKRTRRRRTAPYAGLSPDPPGPPRFPSETLLVEAKEYLRIDNDIYRAVRSTLEEIMQNLGIRKKTDSGEKWAEAKNQLIGCFDQLQSLFSPPSAADDSSAVVPNDRAVDQDKCWLGLEIIANDVAKKIRNQDRRLSIADAKNILGINPAQAVELKNVFHDILKKNHFYSKHTEGRETWDRMKEEWIEGSDLLRSILALPGSDDGGAPAPAETVGEDRGVEGGTRSKSNLDPQTREQHALKVKATEFLARDVMKRLRDSQTRAAKAETTPALPLPPPKLSSSTTAPARATASSGPASPPQIAPTHIAPPPPPTLERGLSSQGISTLASRALASAAAAERPRGQTYAEQEQEQEQEQIQIDPSLLGAGPGSGSGSGAGPSAAPAANADTSLVEGQYYGLSASV
ncbi:MAG: hypothetical protein Q9167_004704 [Letrouitia subvulpina]